MRSWRKDNPDRKAKATDANAVPALVALMGDKGPTPQVQQEAADTLRILVQDSDPTCLSAIRAGLPSALAAAIGAGAPLKLQRNATGLRKEMLRSEGAEVEKALP